MHSFAAWQSVLQGMLSLFSCCVLQDLDRTQVEVSDAVIVLCHKAPADAKQEDLQTITICLAIGKYMQVHNYIGSQLPAVTASTRTTSHSICFAARVGDSGGDVKGIVLAQTLSFLSPCVDARALSIHEDSDKIKALLNDRDPVVHDHGILMLNDMLFVATVKLTCFIDPCSCLRCVSLIRETQSGAVQLPLLQER